MATFPTTITTRAFIVAALFLITVPGGTAQSPAVAPSPPTTAAPAPSLDCTTYLSNTYDCLPYVEAGSNQTKPDKACCPELAELSTSTKPSSFLLSVVSPTPPVELCSEAGYPVGAPTPLPVLGGTAQSPAEAPSPSMGAAPSPSLDCTPYLTNTYDCLSFVEPGSNLTKPDKACCPELADLVKSQPVCLCQLLSSGGDTFGIQINLNKALKLPSLCSVSTPSVKLCSEAGYPVGAPTPLPDAGYPIGASPGGAPIPSEGPGIMPPVTASPASSNNGDSSIAFSHLSFTVGLATAFLTILF
ncbi:hypothetical protein F0562_022521 [Nyssa sinensis]|uniref:Bifunctional inhibitor/plant lipid transfer protein/seed storage helical domain-containing protein n=1 Tax=Nyssa sinensis TaxID=561372 RepID=A0A5J5BNP0_9ASTE|nr:hypothetical protein F0562_022521 [Nyssa sinensis]